LEVRTDESVRRMERNRRVNDGAAGWGFRPVNPAMRRTT